MEEEEGNVSPYSYRKFLLDFVAEESPSSSCTSRPLSERTYHELLSKLGFSAEATERLVRFLKPEEFAPGSTIVKQGDHGNKFYIVFEGVVSVRRNDRHHRDLGVKSHEIARLGHGRFFGDMALLRGYRRTATVVALGPGPTTCYVLSQENFQRLVSADESFLRLLQVVVDQKEEALRRLEIGCEEGGGARATGHELALREAVVTAFRDELSSAVDADADADADAATWRPAPPWRALLQILSFASDTNFGTLCEGVLSRCAIREFEGGEAIVREGERGDAMYIVLSGAVSVTRRRRGRREAPSAADGKDGKRSSASTSSPRHLVCRLYEGQWFGELALLLHQPRIATVKACAPGSGGPGPDATSTATGPCRGARCIVVPSGAFAVLAESERFVREMQRFAREIERIREQRHAVEDSLGVSFSKEYTHIKQAEVTLKPTSSLLERRPTPVS